MLKRILSSVGIVIVAAGVFVGQYYCPIVFDIVVALIALIAMYELAGVFALRESKVFLLAGAAGVIAMVFTIKTPYLLLSFATFTFLIFVINLFYYPKYRFGAVFAFYGMTVLVTLSFGSGILLISREDRIEGMILVILGMLISWLADIGGYFGGRAFGKHKLCPKISPKKTVEGVIGGFVFSAGAICLVGFLLGLIFGKSFSYPALLILSLVGTPLSIAGDLTFSVIKRENGIKDYGNLIPGHGGILDRFDGVAFTLPAMYFIVLYLPVLL